MYVTDDSPSDTIAQAAGLHKLLCGSNRVIRFGRSKTWSLCRVQITEVLTNYAKQANRRSGSGACSPSARQPATARIVSLSSTAHMRAPVDFGDILFERRPYDPQIAYAQSKTANSLFAVEVTKRWAGECIVANAVNPGGVRTGLQRNFAPRQRESLDAAEAAGVFTYKSVEQGALGPAPDRPQAVALRV